jgi:hypothetical protein
LSLEEGLYVEFGTKVKGIIALLVVISGFYVAWNMIPPYFNKYQFQDDLDDVARRTTYMRISDDDIKEVVIKKALARDILIKENQIALSRVGTSVAISVHYSVHVDMIVHPVDLDFTVDSHNKMIGT